jgi:hypothetical protein
MKPLLGCGKTKPLLGCRKNEGTAGMCRKRSQRQDAGKPGHCFGERKTKSLLAGRKIQAIAGMRRNPSHFWDAGKSKPMLTCKENHAIPWMQEKPKVLNNDGCI